MQGLIVPMTNPLDGRKVDFPSKEKHIGFLKENGDPAIFELGMMGESLWMRLEEKKEVIRHAESMQHRELYIGVTHGFPYETDKLIDFVNDIKCEGIVIQPSVINGLYPEDLFDLIQGVANKSKHPIYLYVNEKRSFHHKELLQPEKVSKLAYKHSNILGIKATVADIKPYLEETYPAHFGMFIGSLDGIFTTPYQKKIKGIVNGFGNVMPAALTDAWNAYVSGSDMTKYHDKVSAKIKEFKGKEVDTLHGVKQELMDRHYYMSASCYLDHARQH